MATKTPPPLAERIFEVFSNQLLDWLPEQGPFTIALVCVLIWVSWKTKQHGERMIQTRPELEFLFDLLIDTLVVIAFSLFIRAFTTEIVKYAHGGEGFASTPLGEGMIMCMEALHYIPLLVLFVYQTLRLCILLHQKLKSELSEEAWL